jgi:peptidoglycan/LPS O-acetylase OafA/YrhL
VHSISNRYANIDIIRGLAALLVVWMHVSEVFRSLLPEGKPGEWMFTVADTVDFGRIGVVAFFAVSGFVIPASFNHQGWLGLKLFLVRRFFRLYPAFWLSIPLAIWSTWYLWDKPVTLMQIIANITIVPQLFGQLPMEGLYWTLQIEICFYIFCSILFLFGLLHKTNVLVIVTSLFFIAFLMSKAQAFIALPIHVSDKEGLLSLFLSIMFWGALYRTWHDKKTWQLNWNLILWGLPLTMVVLMLLVSGYRLTHLNAITDTFWFKFTTSHALGLILFLTIALWVKLTFRPLVILGEISYALYLFHPIVFYPFYWWAGRTSLDWIRTMPLEFWVISMTMLSIFVAYFVHRWIELPAIQKGRDITNNIRMKSIAL